jgi:hypothetical protein
LGWLRFGNLQERTSEGEQAAWGVVEAVEKL